MIQILHNPTPLPIYYTGPDVATGPLPALFYFSIAGDESLSLNPYNTPVTYFKNVPCRVFSWTLPGHGEGFDKHQAMHFWAESFAKERNILEEFFDVVSAGIEWLIVQGIIDPAHMAAAGLSRGGFVATHIAARFHNLHTLLAFAPVTDLSVLKAFQNVNSSRLEPLSLCKLSISHLRHLRFYIGNRDTLVGTKTCFKTIETYAEEVHVKHARHCLVELYITQSAGQHGHGTSPGAFEEGTLWLKQHLLGR